MLWKSLYFLAVVLCLVGCVTLSSTPKEPTTQTVTDIFSESFLERFETIDYDNDPYPEVCSLSGVMGNIIGSGVLIAPNVVLTAGHCIDDIELSYVSFGNEIICISETLIHPNYNQRMRVPHDIGLIFLEHEVCGIKPANIHNGQFICRFVDITTVGFSFYFKKFSKPGTFKYYGTVLEEVGEIKFLPRKATIWYGDSGGAVFVDWYDKRILLGIISNFFMLDGEIIECSATRVDMYKGWIEESVKSYEGVLESTTDAINDT